MRERFPLRSAWEHVSRSVPHGVWVLDSKGTVLDANPLLGRWLESASLVGTYAGTWLVEPEAWKTPGETELVLRSTSGIERKVESSCSELRTTRGQVSGYAHVFTSQTVSKAFESRLVQEIQRMAQLAGEDALTGLANRRAFDEALHHMRREQDRRFGVIVVDLDDFKAINDSLGHTVGDTVLKAFGEKLKTLVRDGDLIARIGGDEFAVLLPNVTKVALTDAADRLRESLVVEVVVKGVPFSAFASVGYAHSGDGADTVVERADRWMYQNKAKRELGGLAALAELDPDPDQRRIG